MGNEGKAGMTAAAPIKSVFEFIDYRKYLEYYYAEQKRRTRSFSYRWFAKRAGISSPSFLKFVIDGKRNLTTPMVEKFCQALKLGTKECKYFSTLVLFNQAKTAREKQDHYAVLRFLGNPVFEEVLRVNQYDYFDKWQTPVLRELICLRDFKDDWDAMARTVQPPIAPPEAKQAVQLLLKLGMVSRREEGGYAQTKKGVAADDTITSMAVRSFHAQMMDHAKRALNEFDKRERNMSSLTMGMSPSAYSAVVEEIQAFKDRVKAIVHGDGGGSRVYQFNLELFPVSRDLGRMPAEGAAS